METEIIEFYAKYSIPLIIILVALFNLTMQWGSENFWILMLCTCMAYLMPSPEVRESIKRLNLSKI